MPTFDIVNKLELEAFKNAIDGVNREISTRYDFKGSNSEIANIEKSFFILADSDMKLNQIKELLAKSLARKKVDIKNVSFPEKPEKASGNMLKLEILLVEGINKENAQEIIKIIKKEKIKVQVSIQGDQLRVSGKKRDDLQMTMQLLRENVNNIPLSFINFSD